MTLAAMLLGAEAEPDPANTAAAPAQSVVNRFYAEVLDCGVKPGPKPRLKVELARGVIHYDGSGTIIIYPWETMDQGTHDALASLASSGPPGRTGQEAYQSIFNELLVAHELGHWLQRGRLNGNRWKSEHNANQIMIAFWREHPRGTPTARRLAEYLRFVPGDHNPMPSPSGQSEQTYFNENYAALLRSPAYGWYQNSSGRAAARERPVPRFCALIRDHGNGS